MQFHQEHDSLIMTMKMTNDVSDDKTANSLY